MSESYPHLIFEGFTTKLGKRVVEILKHLFPPREAGKVKEGSRVVTFALAEGDYISVRHHVYVKTGYNSVELAEVGPRMEMKLFELRLGTVDNKDADYEWRLANYTRYVIVECWLWVYGLLTGVLLGLRGRGISCRCRKECVLFLWALFYL